MGKITETPEKYSISIFEKYIFGIMGKKAIYYELTKLPNEYSIYIDIELINVVIDFVVIGPTGIYCITAKSHEVTLGYNGVELTKWKQPFEENFLNQANSEASILKKYLHIKLNKYFDIVPVLVFTSRFAKIAFDLEPINNVFVIQNKWLIKLITKRPHILDINEIKAIENVIQ
ncbi:MAG: nuclease-related domain-containing protein [bacterium]|nr:nuclease-related domain-containing protein [bacterium]